MPVNLDSFTGPGSTPSRRRFWDKITQAVIASQKVEGRNVSCDEHQGMGTLISIPNPNRGRPGPNQGACCDGVGGCTISTEEECSGTFLGIGTDCDPRPCPNPDEGEGACCTGELHDNCVIANATDCAELDGTFQGVGTFCYPDTCGTPTPTGACCQSDGDVISCVADVTESDCLSVFGYYVGDGTDCSGDPCGLVGACCDGCNGCFLTPHDGCPILYGFLDPWLGTVPCTAETGNACCAIAGAVICCEGGEIVHCEDPTICESFGCVVPCPPPIQDGTACSCGGMAFDAGSQFSDPFFTNN